LLGRSLRGFFRYSWLALDGLRRTVHLFLMLLVLGLVLAVIASRPAALPGKFVLVVSPEGVLVEQYSGDPLGRAFDASRGIARSETLVSDLVEAIDEAGGDKRVRAIHLELDDFAGGSIDKLDSLAAALVRFRETGKPVIATAGGLGEPQYYLAAHADELYIDPLGGIMFQGFGFYRSYFKTALEKLSLDWYVFSAGEAKNYGDVYTRDSMSEAERENLRPIVAGLWAAWRADVASARGVDPDLLDDYANRFLPRLRAAGGDTARVALDAGLIDGLRSSAEIEARLVETGGHDGSGDYLGVQVDDYLASLHAKLRLSAADGSGQPAIGLIVARGMIMPGDQPPGMIGDETLRDLLREARDDEEIRALVLRIDSGGGSEFASEAIMREVELVREAGKPVVVSMGSVAASGGYIMSLPADEIWAHPTTVTGSIGAVAMVPNFGRLLGRWGVNVDGVGTHRFSGDFRLDRAFSEDAKEIFNTMVEGAYERFLGNVAAARELSLEDVRAVAEGRVWLGETALAAGLVDRIGSLDDAMSSAAARAGLGEDFEVVRIEPPLGFRDRLMISMLSAGARVGFTAWPSSWVERLPVELRTLVEEIERLDGFADPRGIYYHCLCET
jgi:protease IV